MVYIYISVRYNVWMSSKSEVVIFNGKKFHRYPESKHAHLRRYFTPGIADKTKGLDLLHREIWKHHKGSIPKGMVVHHVDHNPLNNDISNLALMTKQEHSIEHPPTDPEAIKRWKNGMKKARRLATIWRATPEGQEFQKKLGHRVGKILVKFMENYKGVPKVCVKCGNDFTDYSMPKVAKRCFDCRSPSTQATRKIHRRTAPVN